MVTRKILNQYEFKTMHEYFNYIVDSSINGQGMQCKELIKKLSANQRFDLIEHLKDVTGWDTDETKAIVRAMVC